MPRRKRKPNLKLVPKAPEPILHRPPQGEYEEELIGGGHGHAKRLRRIDEHPLTLAYARGKLGKVNSQQAVDRYTAGDIFRARFNEMGRSARDSTDLSVGGGGIGTPWTTIQAKAIRDIGDIKRGMKVVNYRIVRKFCGEGYSMTAALREANVACHHTKVVECVCKALDDLVSVIGDTKLAIAA